jgi:predicted amidohydrolase
LGIAAELPLIPESRFFIGGLAMSVLRIALLQMAAAGTDQDANLAKGDAFCRQAAALGADIALFPEMWNIGYNFFDVQEPFIRTYADGRACDRRTL